MSMTLILPGVCSANCILAELITNEHDIDSIRRLFRELRTCEGKIYKPSCKATPFGIMMDVSLAILSAALLEYNNESYLEYLQRTFEIMTGKAKKKDINHLFVFICTAHIMKNVKKCAARGDPMNTSMKHFAMRFFGRLIHACSLEEASSIVKVGFIVLNSQYVTFCCHRKSNASYKYIYLRCNTSQPGR